MEFQDFVCTLLARQHIVLQNLASKKYQYEVGENLQGFEIKLDQTCSRSLRLSIEVAEKADGTSQKWAESGILRDDNTWLYIQGNYQVIFVFAKNHLRRYLGQKAPPIVEWGKDPSKPTVKRFFLPFVVARVMAAKVIDLG